MALSYSSRSKSAFPMISLSRRSATSLPEAALMRSSLQHICFCQRCKRWLLLGTRSACCNCLKGAEGPSMWLLAKLYPRKSSALANVSVG